MQKQASKTELVLIATTYNDTRDLYNAVEGNDATKASEILEATEADPNSITCVTHGYRPQSMLCIAVRNRNEVLVDLLLENDAKPNLKSPLSSEYPLDTAVLTRNIRLTRRLLRAGASFNKWQTREARISRANHTIINAATVRDNCEILKMLLDAGAPINTRHPEYRHTALMMAAWWGNTSNVQFLLEQGANATFRNSDQLSALDLAKSKGYQEIIFMLEARYNPCKKFKCEPI